VGEFVTYCKMGYTCITRRKVCNRCTSKQDTYLRIGIFIQVIPTFVCQLFMALISVFVCQFSYYGVPLTFPPNVTP